MLRLSHGCIHEWYQARLNLLPLALVFIVICKTGFNCLFMSVTFELSFISIFLWILFLWTWIYYLILRPVDATFLKTDRNVDTRSNFWKFVFWWDVAPKTFSSSCLAEDSTRRKFFLCACGSCVYDNVDGYAQCLDALAKEKQNKSSCWESFSIVEICFVFSSRSSFSSGIEENRAAHRKIKTFGCCCCSCVIYYAENISRAS